MAWPAHPALLPHTQTRISARAWVRRISLAAGTFCLCTPSAGAAHAAHAVTPWPPAVQQVLDHLAANPMTVTSAPMQYDAQPTTPLPPCVRDLTPADVLPRQRSSSGSGSSGNTTAASATSTPASRADAAGGGVSARASQADHYAAVVTALLCAACGGLDRAHNLVTPLCWAAWTPYGGSPVAGSPAAAEAAHAHAIVHRQEGLCDGEFGSGFSNASYWYRVAGPAGFSHELLEQAARLAEGYPVLQQHVASHGASWSPERFLGLCKQVAASGAAARPEPEQQRRQQQLRRFCEGVMAAELRLLLEHCYHRMQPTPGPV